MKKIVSIVVFISLIFLNFQVGQIYAYNEKILEVEKQKSTDFLDKVELALDNATNKIGGKIKNENLKEKLEEKKEEIKETLKDAKEDIQKESSKKEIKQIALDTRKTVVLKVVSGITKDNLLNGHHETIKIGDKIYDNINPKGVDINVWKEDLGFGHISGPIFIK